jgi:GGDEF domain-containing protein
LRARAERDALRHQLAIAETDPLTGTRTRAPGLTDLDHEIDRARRTTDILAVAYVDVDGLKRAIRAHLRSYDMIMRLGGDEFLCVMSGATIEDARQRFGSVHAALAADPDPCEIKVGFAALAPEDSAAELIERADADLPNRRAEWSRRRRSCCWRTWSGVTSRPSGARHRDGSGSIRARRRSRATGRRVEAPRT